MPRGERARRSEGGFTYLGLLFLVALIGLMLAAAGEVAATAAQRERETQLLWVGHEYRAAIGRYWNSQASLSADAGGAARLPHRTPRFRSAISGACIRTR